MLKISEITLGFPPFQKPCQSSFEQICTMDLVRYFRLFEIHRLTGHSQLKKSSGISQTKNQIATMKPSQHRSIDEFQAIEKFRRGLFCKCVRNFAFLFTYWGNPRNSIHEHKTLIKVPGTPATPVRFCVTFFIHMESTCDKLISNVYQHILMLNIKQQFKY